MTRLAIRLSLAGGRETLARLAVTVVSIALGVALLLLSLGFEPATRQRAWRDAQRGQSLDEPTTDDPGHTAAESLLIAQTDDHYLGRSLTVLHVASRSQRPPVPPGLPRVPKRGEVFVSPALGDLLASQGGGLLRDRFDGEVANVEIGRQALLSPWELVAWVGAEPDVVEAAARGRAASDFPLPAPTTGWWQAKLPVRLGIAIGVVGLILPILVLVGVMTRLGAAQRERRLATLRLVGATPAQTRHVAVTESAIVAAIGSATGVLVFLAARPLAARIPVDGARWFASDFSPPLLAAAGVLIAVPVLAAASALLTMRKVKVSPLGIARRSATRAPSPSRLVVLVGGLIALASAALAAEQLPTGELVLLATAGLAATIIGLPAAGPLLTGRIGGWLASRTRHAPVLLAARRLRADPSGAFRASSGVMIAVFVATVFYGYSNGNLGAILSSDLTGDDTAHINLHGAAPAAVNELLSRLLSVDGVVEHVAIRDAFTSEEAWHNVVVADCEALVSFELARAEPCPDADVFIGEYRPGPLPETLVLSSQPADRDAATAAVTLPANRGTFEMGRVRVVDLSTVLAAPVVIDPSLLPDEFVRSLRTGSLLVRTDGSPATVERLRNLVVPLLPGREANTQQTLNTESNRAIAEVQRGINLVVAITLVVAAVSLAATTAGGMLERRRPLTLLRASGMSVTTLYATSMAETAIPLLLSTVVSAALGIAASAAFVAAVDASFSPPVTQALALVASGVVAGVTMLALVLPVVSRATTPKALRTE